MLAGFSLLHHAPEGFHLDQVCSGYHLGVRYCPSDAYLCSMRVIFFSVDRARIEISFPVYQYTVTHFGDFLHLFSIPSSSPVRPTCG
jgi:hypothetical protein